MQGARGQPQTFLLPAQLPSELLFCLWLQLGECSRACRSSRVSSTTRPSRLLRFRLSSPSTDSTWTKSSTLSSLSVRLVRFACLIDHGGTDACLSPKIAETFNEFFYRKLKPEVRPIDQDPNSIVSSADCRLMAFDTVSLAKKIWIKGRDFRCVSSSPRSRRAFG